MLKNITLRIDEDTLKRGKHIAVEQGKSLSKWVTELIEKSSHNASEVNKARAHALKMIKKGVNLGKATFREKVHMNERLREIVSAEVFVDTNILFYGVNIGNPEKYALAGSILELLWQKTELPSISPQVLQGVLRNSDPK